jgi:hypothetical protein
MRSSRRKFLTLVAAASAAVAARPAASLAANAPAPKAKPAPAKKPATAAAPALPADPKLREGIAQQQRDLAKALKTLRDYPLEPGSDPAFVFAPVRAARPRSKP